MTDVVDSQPSETRGPRVRWAYLVGIVLILIGVGTVAYQAWPELSYELGLVETDYPYPCAFADAENAPPLSDRLPRGARLVIPRIGVDAQIYEGAEERALDRGVYHHVETADPGEEDNIAIAGHRVRRAFTLLHRLSPGDPVVVYWNGQEHDYRIERVFEIGPEETAILEPTGTEQLTLYTCTPRFLGDRRTVAVALPASP